tara:strand:- start:5990 stop:6202 length:213 start_codon:yes stop_codon:yes gene_type:complete
MSKKRFTFADAKQKIKDLEQKVNDAKKEAGDLILDTSDNIFTNKELRKIKFLELWAILGPIIGILIGLLF